MVALQFPVLRGGELLHWQAMVNVTANLLGVATLALPYAMAEAGFIFSCVALLVAVKASYSTWKMLVELSAFDGIAGRISYPEIGRRVLGVEGHLAVLVAYVLYSGGLLVCQLCALSDVLLIFLPDWQGWTLWLAIALASPGVLWPKAPAGQLISVSCIGAAVALAVSLLMVSADLGAQAGPSLSEGFKGPSFTGLLSSFAIFLAQFSVQSSFEVTTAIGDLEEDFGGVLVNFANAFIFALGTSLALAMAGYVHFGSNVQCNVLLSWTAVESPLATLQWLRVTEAVYILSLVVGASLSSRPCVASIQEILGGSRRGFTGPSHSPQKALPVLLGCGVISWLQGMSSGLGSSLKWLGAFGASPLVLLLPPLFYVEMARRQGGRSLVSPENATSMIPLALGLLLTIGTFFEIVTSSMSSPLGHRGDRTVTSSLTNITASRWR